TATATALLTATATPVGTPTPTPGPLVVGGRARVTVAGWAYLNVRTEPSAQAEIVGTLKRDAEVTILEGPVEADGFRWWKLDDGEGLVGWAVEGTETERWLVPIE
ncbi:MAG: SH3 domain-containing protein, partial [Chloroflexi bacterium]